MSTSIPSRTPDRPGLADAAVDEALHEAGLVGSARRRVRAGASADRRSALLSGGSFLAVATLWLVLDPPAAVSLPIVSACVAVLALASSVEFEIGPGSVVPTTPALIVSVFLAPPTLVPWVVLAGLTLAAAAAGLRDRDRRESVLVLACSSWHAFGPALVVALWPRPVTGPAGTAVLVAVALAAQIVVDLASTLVRTTWGLGVPWPTLRRAYRFTVLVDLLLAPLGLAAALAAPAGIWGLALIVPPLGLLALLQSDRRQVIDRTLVLGRAVSETADQARTDVLTGLRNRLAWEEHLVALSGTTEPVGVVLLDVDGLKAANDTWGHETGDRLLRAVADVVAAHRPVDHTAVAARLGGDEFGLLLPGPLAADAPAVARQLTSAFAALEPLDGRVPVSASVGRAVVGDGGGIADGLARADHEVNREKQARGVRRT